eukprot:8659249-Pyramimonas_sp.AAC.1
MNPLGPPQRQVLLGELNGNSNALHKAPTVGHSKEEGCHWFLLAIEVPGVKLGEACWTFGVALEGSGVSLEGSFLEGMAFPLGSGDPPSGAPHDIAPSSFLLSTLPCSALP